LNRTERREKKRRNDDGDGDEDDTALDELIGLIKDTDLTDDEDSSHSGGETENTEDTGVQAEVDMFMAKGGYQVTYIGSLSVGRFGDKSLLDPSIDRVARDQYGVRHPVSLHVMEFGTRMYSAATGQKVLYYPYPQISACGCSTANSHYFAFIAGNDLCALSTDFLCHVFFSDSTALAEEVIANIAAGFKRTHHAA